jgi:hypothetical protein
MARPYLKPADQDEGGAVIKSLHICPTRGCRSVMDKDNKRCDDCRPAEARKIIEAEYDTIYAPKIAAGVL